MADSGLVFHGDDTHRTVTVTPVQGQLGTASITLTTTRSDGNSASTSKEFWKQRLQGTEVLFSLVENVYVRTHGPDNDEMGRLTRRTYPTSPCAQPRLYLLIHYDGDACCCCEDMHGELLKYNVHEMSIHGIWYSERHAEVIRALKIGDRRQYDLCANCTMGPSRDSRNPRRAIRHFDR